MAINLGSSSISTIYLGSSAISKVYLGATEVFSGAGGTITSLDTALIMDRSWVQSVSGLYRAYLLNHNGDRVIIMDALGTLRERTLGTAFDPSTTSGSDTDTLVVSGLSGYVSVQEILLNRAGDQLGVLYRISGGCRLAVYTSSGSDATDLSTLGSPTIITLTGGANDPELITSVQLNADGSSMYLSSSTTKRVHRFDMGTADDLTTCGTSSASETGSITALGSMLIMPDESKIYIERSSALTEYTFTTPGDLTEITSFLSLSAWADFSGSPLSISSMKLVDSDTKVLVHYSSFFNAVSTVTAIYDAVQTSITDIDTIKASFWMTAGADTTYLNAMNTLITGAKTDGWWSKMDHFVVMAVPNSMVNVINWKTNNGQPAGTQNMVYNGTLTLDENVGVSGGSTSNYIRLDAVNLSVLRLGVEGIGFYNQNVPTNSGFVFGVDGGGTNEIVNMQLVGSKWRINQVGTTFNWSTNATTDTLVWAVWDSASAGRAGDGYIDGTSDVTFGGNSVTISAPDDVYLFCQNSNGTPSSAVDSAFKMSLFFFSRNGGAMTAADGTNMNTRFETFLAAIAP